MTRILDLYDLVKFAYMGKFRCTYRYAPSYFRPNQFYRMDSTSSSTSTRPSQAALVKAEVEVEAQPTGLTGQQGKVEVEAMAYFSWILILFSNF